MAWILHDVCLAMPPADCERRLKRRLANPATGCVACSERIFGRDQSGTLTAATVWLFLFISAPSSGNRWQSLTVPSAPQRGIETPQSTATRSPGQDTLITPELSSG